MRPLPARALIAIAASLLLLGCSTSYHAGDKAAAQWDAWVKDHPLAGARVTDRVGRNVQPFQGDFEAYARLTAARTEDDIVKAMASMCRFNSATGASTTYWLQIDRVSLQAPCSKGDQQKVARFWTAVHQLPGIIELAFSSKGLSLTADDAHLVALVQPISDAADQTGHAGTGSSNDYRSDRVTITQAKGADLAAELRQTQGVLDLAGNDVKKIEVVAGRVSAATRGTPTQAHDWQQAVGQGSPVLTVTPNHVTTELPFTGRGRDLVDRLAVDPRVGAINVVSAFWEIETRSTRDARSLITMLADEPATTDLGRLQLDVGPSSYDSVQGTGRTCFVRPDFAASSHAAALLDLCDLQEAVEVDDRFDAALDLRLTTANVRRALACLKRAPFGLPVYLMLPQNNTEEFTTGKTLKSDHPGTGSSQELETVWESLPA